MSVDLGGRLYTDALEAYRRLASTFLERSDWVHYSQFMQSLGSVVANIAEGTGRKLKSIKYYQNFLLTSRGAIYETLAWLDCFITLYPENETSLKYGVQMLRALEKELTEELVKNT